jgi:hypothetical protein
MDRTNVIAAQNVLQKLRHIVPIIHEVLDKAITQARGFFDNRTEEIDTFLFPSLVRYEAKCLFADPRYRSVSYQFVILSSNGLLLVYECEGRVYNIRVRKADEDGDLPTQNLSHTLKQFYTQPQPYLPGLSPKDINDLIDPESMNLVVVWDVDRNYVLSELFLVCPKNEFGEIHFADKIEHAALSISASADFDDEAEEIEEIDIEPLEDTGTDNKIDEDGQND